MTFCLILMVFLFQRFLGAAYRWHRAPFLPNMLTKLSRWLQSNVKSAWAQVTIFLGLCAGCVLGVVLLLQMTLGGLGYFIYAFVVLWYCLNAYQTGWQKQLEQADSKHVPALFVVAYARIFAVIFWFLIFGPVGAVIYRVLCLLQHDEKLAKASAPWQPVVGNIRGVIDWLPLRIVGLTYALSGHFVPTFTLWRRQFRIITAQPNVIGGWGSTALHFVADNASERPGIAAGQLIDRAIWVWLVILALLSFSSLLV